MAPEAAKVAVLPLQIIVGLLDAVIVGDGFTEILITAVEVQAPFEPVTV